jgi:hypothetical protein
MFKALGELLTAGIVTMPECSVLAEPISAGHVYELQSMNRTPLYGKRAHECHIYCDISKCTTLPPSCAGPSLKGPGCTCLLHSRLRNSAGYLFM